jgi:hypothetical protein
MRHTPGPWSCRGSLGPHSNPHLKGPHIVEDAGGTQIAIMNGWSTDKTAANARLIAEAPALLEALLEAYDAMREPHGDWHDERCNRAIIRASAVIKKATGEKGES